MGYSLLSYWMYDCMQLSLFVFLRKLFNLEAKSFLSEILIASGKSILEIQ